MLNSACEVRIDPGDGTPSVVTARLLLRPFTMDDAATVATLAADRRIAETTLLIPHPYQLSHARDWIRTHDAAWRCWPTACVMDFAITLAQEHTLVGAIGIAGTPGHRRAEVGYWIGVPFWNRGYAREALAAVVTFAWLHLPLDRLSAGVFEGNSASQRVLEACGFEAEGVLRKHYLKDGRRLDSVQFGLLRSAN